MVNLFGIDPHIHFDIMPIVNLRNKAIKDRVIALNKALIVLHF